MRSMSLKDFESIISAKKVKSFQCKSISKQLLWTRECISDLKKFPRGERLGQDDANHQVRWCYSSRRICLLLYEFQDLMPVLLMLKEYSPCSWQWSWLCSPQGTCNLQSICWIPLHQSLQSAAQTVEFKVLHTILVHTPFRKILNVCPGLTKRK